MLQSLKFRNIKFTLPALVLVLGLEASLNFGLAASENNTAKLLELSGGRRVKVTWIQGTEKKKSLMFYDTKDGIIRELPFVGGAPLLTIDGKRILTATEGPAASRALMMYDTETMKAIQIASGPNNNLIATWQDPKTKRDWVYVNDGGDNGQAWNAPCGKIYRFPIDKPEERELFWDRTSSHIYLMFSADGTRACFEPSWSNIGQLKLAFDAQGKIDQEKSTYKQFGGGCFPSMAPDNSYRMFRLEGDHRAIALCDADNANIRKVSIVGMLNETQKSKNCWLTRWSTHPRYMTLMAPAGPEAQIWLGRFDEKFTKIESWVRVSAEKGPQCWQSHAWIKPDVENSKDE